MKRLLGTAVAFAAEKFAPITPRETIALFNGKAPWMRSVEDQIIEGGTGDVILVGGDERGQAGPIFPTLMTKVRPGPKNCNPAGVPTEFEKNRIDWQFRDPEWKDVLGFRGKKDVERPVGEWNQGEAICAGGDVIYFLRGVNVNEATDGNFQAGPLHFQSEGVEIFSRKIELHPLKK